MDLENLENGGISGWIEFFKEAGIPTGLGANYAVLFCDHRITRSVLGDLTREILFDMGVKAMGDVIAILKHAGLVSREISREKTTKLISKTVLDPHSDHKSTAGSKLEKGSKQAVKSSVKSMNVKSSSTSSGKEVFGRLGKEASSKTVFNRLGEDRAKPEQGKASAVFNRLGEPVVSSTSADVSSNTGGGLETKHVSIKKKTVHDRLGPERQRKEKSSSKHEEDMEVDEPRSASPKISVILPDSLDITPTRKKVQTAKRPLGKRSHTPDESESSSESDSEYSESSEEDVPVTKTIKAIPATKRARVHKRNLTDSVLNEKQKIIRRIGSKSAKPQVREWDAGKGDSIVTSSTSREWDQGKGKDAVSRGRNLGKSIQSRLGKKNDGNVETISAKRNTSGSVREWDAGKSSIQHSAVSSSVREWDADKGKKRFNQKQKSNVKNSSKGRQQWSSGNGAVVPEGTREWDAGKAGHKRVKSVPTGVKLNKSTKLKNRLGPVSANIVSSSSGGKKSNVFARLGS